MTAPALEVHGHRGSRGTHPENTFAAFEEAWRVGADWFEIDVRPTADGAIVVFHDPVVDASNARRLDGTPIVGATPVFSMTRHELDQFDVGFARKARFPGQQAVQGSRIPSLVDVFRWLGRRPAIAVNVELKPDGIPEDDAMVDRYCRLVADAMAAVPDPSRVMLQSFDPRLVTVLKRRYPRVRTAVLFEGEADFFAVAAAAGADGIGPFQEVVDRSLAEQCRRHNLKLVPWTVNSMERCQALIAMGVAGIITDYPGTLCQLIGRRPNS